MEKEINKFKITSETVTEKVKKDPIATYKNFRNNKNHDNFFKHKESNFTSENTEDIRFRELKNERPKFSNWNKGNSKVYNYFSKDKNFRTNENHKNSKNKVNYKNYNIFNDNSCLDYNKKEFNPEFINSNFSYQKSNKKHWEYVNYNINYNNKHNYNNYNNQKYPKNDFNSKINYKNNYNNKLNTKIEHNHYSNSRRNFNQKKDILTDLNSELGEIENNKFLASRNNSEPNLKDIRTNDILFKTKKFIGKKYKKKRCVIKPRSPNNTTQFLISVHTKKERDKLKKEKMKSKKKILKDNEKIISNLCCDLPLNENAEIKDFDYKKDKVDEISSPLKTKCASKKINILPRINHHSRTIIKENKSFTNRQQDRSISGENWNNLVPGGSMMDFVSNNTKYEGRDKSNDNLNTINSFYS